MNRIENIFAKGKAYIGYLTAGDGGIENTFRYAMALIKGGVNILEIGIPFSDPVADGPVIQRAAERALQNGFKTEKILTLIKNIRDQSDIPIILFSYLNPILALEKKNFLKQAKAAGADGLLIVDCPIEQSENIHQSCLQHQLMPIYLLAPTTCNERIAKINEKGQGFLYYASRKGTTGIKNDLPENFIEKISHIKKYVNLPVVVGFGVSKSETVKTILNYADGVVIGSLFVQAIENKITPENLTVLAKQIFGSSPAEATTVF